MYKFTEILIYVNIYRSWQTNTVQSFFIMFAVSLKSNYEVETIKIVIILEYPEVRKQGTAVNKNAVFHCKRL